MTLDTERLRARAIDALTYRYNDGKPMDASVRRRANNRYEVRWTIFAAEARPSGVEVNMIFDFNTERLNGDIRAKFPKVNVENRERGRATCKVLPGESFY